MATFLYRVGNFAYRRKFIVLGVWVVLLAAFILGSNALSKPYSNEFSLPGTASETAINLLKEKFPSQDEEQEKASVQVVFEAAPGKKLSDPDQLAAVRKTVDALKGLPDVAAPDKVIDPVAAADAVPDKSMSPLSEDGTIGYVSVPFTTKFTDVSKDTVAKFNDVVSQGRTDGLTLEATGTLLQSTGPEGGASEAIGFVVAFIVMIIAFGCLVASFLPLITAIVGVGISLTAITGATHFFDINSSVDLIASMIGIAVSIDYALFIVSRFRQELVDNDNRADAAGRAVGTAGSSVVFAGLTVIIALSALSVVGIPFMTAMGLGAAFAVVTAVCAAITLLPAILGLFGRAAFLGKIKFLRQPDAPDTQNSNGLRWVNFVIKRPVVVLVGAVVILAIFAIPAFKMELGMDTKSGAEKRAVALIGKGFGEGVTGPLTVVVDGDGVTGDRTTAYATVVDKIRALPDVKSVSDALPNKDGSGALIQVTPTSGPSSPDTKTLVDDIRGLNGDLKSSIGTELGVAGQTAILSDLSSALLKALIPYLLVVVGLAFLVLLVVFRSILVPLTATLGFLLSVGATFGVTVAIFQEGWFGLISDAAPIISFLPIFMVGMVFGLAMDYQVFLVTRMREEFVHGAHADQSVRLGFQHGARVVSSAAVIMISVFAAFILTPDTIGKEMGFALAAAVFFDAFIVRMAVIPAVMALLGDRAWYLPTWLDKILPNVDIEGEKLREKLDPKPEQRLDLAKR